MLALKTCLWVKYTFGSHFLGKANHMATPNSRGVEKQSYHMLGSESDVSDGGTV